MVGGGHRYPKQAGEVYASAKQLAWPAQLQKQPPPVTPGHTCLHWPGSGMHDKPGSALCKHLLHSAHTFCWR